MSMRSKQFAFVTFEDSESAERALSARGLTIDGRIVEVRCVAGFVFPLLSASSSPLFCSVQISLALTKEANSRRLGSDVRAAPLDARRTYPPAVTNPQYNRPAYPGPPPANYRGATPPLPPQQYPGPSQPAWNGHEEHRPYSYNGPEDFNAPPAGQFRPQPQFANYPNNYPNQYGTPMAAPQPSRPASNFSPADGGSNELEVLAMALRSLPPGSLQGSSLSGGLPSGPAQGVGLQPFQPMSHLHASTSAASLTSYSSYSDSFTPSYAGASPASSNSMSGSTRDFSRPSYRGAPGESESPNADSSPWTLPAGNAVGASSGTMSAARLNDMASVANAFNALRMQQQPTQPPSGPSPQ
jgi:hypothetical protein